MAMVITLLVWFRRRFSEQGRLTKAMSGAAYATYVFHAPIIFLLALALRGWVKAGTAGEWYPSLAPGTTDASQIAILRLAEMRRVAAVISGVCVVDVIGKHFSGSVEPVVLSRSLLVTADCG